MKKWWFLLLIPLVPCALTLSASPEKARMSAEALASTATHIVIGRVQKVYSYQEKKDGYRYTHSIAELKLEQQTKGEKINASTPLYLRWFVRQDTRARVGGSGHYGWTPKPGDRVKAYVARNAYDGWNVAEKNQDGGYNLIVPNGFEKLPPAEAEK